MQLRGKKILISAVLVLVLLGVGFGSGFFVGKNSVETRILQSSGVNLSIFWDTYNLLREKFVSPEKIDDQKILYGAISGMVQSLGDPYTVFMNPDDTKRFMEDVNGTFEGIGAEVGERKGQLLIIAPLEGSPAKAAGLKPGDQIVQIDGKDTAGMTVDEAVNLIRGPKDTEVTLTIYRTDWQKTQDIKIKRAVIEVPSVKLEYIDSPQGKIAHITIYQFSEKTVSDFRDKAIEVFNSPAKKIILDLRNNPGGYLEVSQDIAGWFLEKGQIVVIEDSGNGKPRKEYKAMGNAAFSDYKVVALINEGSASASEILAGCLRDNRGIKLIGEKSFGKGSVQELERIPGGSSLKVTIAKWLTPSGKLIADIGLEPDEKISITDSDIEAGKDPQLEKAIEIINNL